MDVIAEARHVFDVEINALQMTKQCIGDAFVNILNSILACTGKVVITGIGKPGHVAAKLASTFSSLGTPAFCLHPGEAMHGDLGMISSNDIVIAISYSGESEELLKIVPSIKTIGATLICITGNGKSTLAKAADIVQTFPKFEEACYLGLAPTSSTTVELCYGDALAILASEVTGFQKSDFGRLHPAGALGKKLLLKVDDIMSVGEEIPIVNEEASLLEAISEMTAKCKGAVIVTDENSVIKGIITDADLRRVIAQKGNLYELGVRAAMNRTPIVFSESRLAADALVFMREKNINVMPIIDNHNIIKGILHIQQIVRAGIIV